MGKSDFLTPKAIANRIKSKGLQKLRWYCQMCQKQCRDEVSGPGMAPCPVLCLVQLETRAQAPDAEGEGVDLRSLVLRSVLGESASQHSRDLSLQPPTWWEPIVWKPLSSQSAPQRNEK